MKSPHGQKIEQISTLNETLVKKFTQSALDNAVKADFKKKGVRITHSVFEEIEALIEQIQPSDLFKKIILYHYRQGIQKKLLEYKANHPEKSFDDLLRLLKEALHGEGGEQLAELIRFQYPFAMIDEFQDTDALQYQIFSKLSQLNRVW